MPNEKITALPTTAAATLSDTIYAVQAGIDVQETLAQVITLALASDTLNFAGNPNGSVAGVVYQRCWDTTHNLVWFCTTSGSAATAVWVPSFGTMTNGQLIIGSTGAAPVVSTLTAGSGITVTNAAGSITLATSSGGLSTVVVSGASATLTVNSLTIVTHTGGVCALTLPTTSIVGDTISIVGGDSCNGWSIGYSTGQSIWVSPSHSTVTTGSIASTSHTDCVNLVCTTANTTWVATDQQSVGLTIV